MSITELDVIGSQPTSAGILDTEFLGSPGFYYAYNHLNESQWKAKESHHQDRCVLYNCVVFALLSFGISIESAWLPKGMGGLLWRI